MAKYEVVKPISEAFDSRAFYFALSLPAAESSYFMTMNQSVNNEEKAVPQKRIRRKEKTKVRMEVKLKTARDKLENLTITVKNDGSKKKKNEKVEKAGDQQVGQKALLERLTNLQKGKISTESLTKLPKESKVDDFEKIKKEVNLLNMKIRDKIRDDIKPKIREVIVDKSGRLNGMIKDHHQNSVHDPQPRRLQLPRQTRFIPIAKTRISNEIEIYRYSFDDLFQLQSSTTWSLVPRLLHLNICRTTLSESDKLIFKLLNVDTDENVKISNLYKTVLAEAALKGFIRLTGENTFEFNKIENSESESSKSKIQQTTANDIEKIKMTARTDEELNERIYRLEFNNIFGESKHQNLSDDVKELIEMKKAYVIEGEVRVNSKNHQEAYISDPKKEKDVCIPKLILRQHSFHGDYVKVLVKQEDETMATEDSDVAVRNYGCVIDIIEKRHSRRVVGSISGNGVTRKKNLNFIPRDLKVPSVRVGRDGVPKDIPITDQSLLVVEITGFSYDVARGKIVDIVGVKGDLKTENEAILLQHNLDPQPFPQHIVDEFSSDFVIPKSEFANREDLRKKCIFSIDPESARDLDDALSCEELPNGHVEIGVHISDVSFFLKENSALDDIVKEKATTIYLVDQVYHMLPLPLCLTCSLLPGTDKIAYSVFWEMDQESGEIFNTRFTRSIVNSCGKLSYDHAQAVIEGNSCEFPEIYNNFTVDDVSKVILKLQKIAVILRNSRKEKGALKIDQPKIAFKFKDDKYTAPVDFFKYETKDSNRLIEEFMLLANISVAKFIYEKFPAISLLRSHPFPNEGALKKLVKTLEKCGIVIDTRSSASISESMEKLTKNDSGMNGALNLMVSKTMNRARYFCSDTAVQETDFWHYALSIPMYTHFTSPIRRYADVLVHRVLNAALGYEPEPSRTPEEIQTLANVCNVQKYNAKLAGDDSSELYFKAFIKALGSKAMSAGVLGVYEFNLEVVLLETGHAIKVYYKNLQQNDNVIIKPFNETSPPYVSIILPNSDKPPMKISFGSSLLAQVEVFKEKLIINRIFYNDL